MLRLSGILWAADPYDVAEDQDLATDYYDNDARSLLLQHERASVTYDIIRHWFDDERYQCRISLKYAKAAVQYLWCERRLVFDGGDLPDDLYRLSGILWAEDVANYIERCDDLAYDLVAATKSWDFVTQENIEKFFERCGVKITPATSMLIWSFFGLVEFPIEV